METGRSSGSIISVLKEVSVKTRLEKSGCEANVNRHLQLRLASTIFINRNLFGPCIYSLKGIRTAAFLSGAVMQLAALRIQDAILQVDTGVSLCVFLCIFF